MDNSTSMFSADKKLLSEIIRSISNGSCQLPDFQRPWVWDNNRIIKLLSSVCQSHPIGSIMLYSSGHPDVRFKPKPIEGAPEMKIIPEHFILDGQQRLTALYQTLMTQKPVRTRDENNKEIHRWYYLDINNILEENLDVEDCIYSLPEDKIQRGFGKDVIIRDYSNRDSEFKNLVFPLSEYSNWDDWRDKFQEYWGYDKEKSKLINLFGKKVIQTFTTYQLPIITITKEAPKAAVCKIFENVNTGGVPLNVFELLTASFASEDYELKKDWDSIFSNLARFQVFCDGRSQGDRIENTIFLQALTLVVTYYRKQNTDESSLKPNEKPPAISCKREAILDLKLKEYTDNKESIVEAFINVAGFLHSQKIFSHKDLPYNTQLTPLVAIFSILRNHIKSQSVIEKISRWFWCGIIGEFYSGPVETQFSRDTHEVVMWIKNSDQEPSVIRNINFRPSRLVELRSRNSAVYKGINALLMKEGAADFITGNAIDEHIFIDDTIDIHHIFPKDWCEKQNIKKEIYNSILNKTPLSSYTNRIISNKPPSKYLEIIKNKHLNDSTEKLNTILDSHLVDPEIIKKDEFYLTMKKRALKLIEKIETSIGKEIIKDFQFVDNYSSEENEDDY